MKQSALLALSHDENNALREILVDLLICSTPDVEFGSRDFADVIEKWRRHSPHFVYSHLLEWPEEFNHAIDVHARLDHIADILDRLTGRRCLEGVAS